VDRSGAGRGDIDDARVRQGSAGGPREGALLISALALPPTALAWRGSVKR
jgi:hypothetical protein